MTIGWHFDNTYSKLSKTFREEIKPTPVHDPNLVILNEELAKNLNLDFSKIDNKDLAKLFSGNVLPNDTNTIAQAYAGHQFGHFTMLGDGRAVLLGEHISKNNERFDIQFKGSGQTPFSRNGDEENSANRFFVGIGFDLGLRINSYTKLKYTKNNKSIVNVSKNDFGLAKYRYSTSITFGNDNFNLFIKYFLSDFFQSGNSPEFISNKPVLLKTGFSFSLF